MLINKQNNTTPYHFSIFLFLYPGSTLPQHHFPIIWYLEAKFCPNSVRLECPPLSMDKVVRWKLSIRGGRSRITGDGILKRTKIWSLQGSIQMMNESTSRALSSWPDLEILSSSPPENQEPLTPLSPLEAEK
jgi:hypothetical protein